MLKFKALAVLSILVGSLVFGVITAHGWWWWNSRVDIEGAELRTIWTVTDHEDDDYAYYYNTDVTITRPKKASASIIEVASNETVTLKKKGKLKCTNDGIEVEVDATVNAQPGAPGTQAEITLEVDGQVVSVASGAVGQNIHQEILVPGSC